jgi:hypothetical protein
MTKRTVQHSGGALFCLGKGLPEEVLLPGDILPGDILLL